MRLLVNYYFIFIYVVTFFFFDRRQGALRFCY